MVILRNAAFEGREVLTEDEAKKILKYYNFPVVKTAAANNVMKLLRLRRKWVSQLC